MLGKVAYMTCTIYSYIHVYSIIDLGMYMYMQNCEELLKYHPLFEALRILGLHRIAWYACTPIKDGDKAVVPVPHVIGVQVYKCQGTKLR